MDERGNLSVLVEMRYQPGGSAAQTLSLARGMDGNDFVLDHEYEPVRLGQSGSGFGERSVTSTETYVVRGTVEDEAAMEALQRRPEVAGVWRDTPIAPFVDWDDPKPDPVSNEGMAACPIPPCDCSPGTPKGTIADVATYLGCDQIWADGVRGNGIVVGVLDSGITAQGRPVKDGETPRRIPRVIGGWPLDDWGTESGKWGDHGNMCATDVLGMAPDAQLYDLRIAGAGGSPGTISRALQAFNWAINRFRADGTPQVLTNSWGIFREDWDPTYARNPNHPFTRKVVEAIEEGILVLFAAGNCGDTCPDGRCGPDNGPGRSIWGANGHPDVMTVGAVNRNEEFVGYSSRGPAALDVNKPDFCSITHFTGYHPSDSGTSAATPILAGAVALLKEANPAVTQEEIKTALRATAKDIGPAGFDQHSGAGVVQIKAAFDQLSPPLPPRPSVPIAICRPTIVEPGCGIRPTTIGPRCIRPTLVGPRCPRPTTTDPRCIRPTLVGPECPRPTTVDPRCIRPTLVGPRCPRPTTVDPRCIRPTVVGPRCPRPTMADPRCIRPTLAGPRCPRRTLVGPDCIRPTLAGPRCPRPTFTGPRCPGPRPTLAGPGCPGPRPTLAGCPRPSLACAFGPEQDSDYWGYEDYASADAYADQWDHVSYDEPYADAYQDGYVHDARNGYGDYDEYDPEDEYWTDGYWMDDEDYWYS